MPLDNFVALECANGETMPYFGYIQVDIQTIGIPTDHVQSCILLIVPDTKYNFKLPILLGTNILREFLSDCREKLVSNFLQNAALYTPWYLAFRCMNVRQKELNRNKYRLAVIRSIENSNITIPANSTVTIQGVITKELDYHPTCAMLVQTETSVIPDIAPAVVHYYPGKNGVINLQITNVTTSTFTVAPKAVLCELQPVHVD